MSPELYEKCVKQVYDFVNREFLVHARKNVGHMCAAASFANPKRSLALFVPMCVDHLLQNNSSGELKHLTESETTWYMHILGQVVFRCGAHIIPYKYVKKDAQLTCIDNKYLPLSKPRCTAKTSQLSNAVVNLSRI